MSEQKKLPDNLEDALNEIYKMQLHLEYQKGLVEHREGYIDHLETGIINHCSSTPNAILSSVLGVKTVEGLTVRFGRVEESGRIEMDVHRGVEISGGVCIKSGVTGACAPDDLDREIDLKRLLKSARETDLELRQYKDTNESLAVCEKEEHHARMFHSDELPCLICEVDKLKNNQSERLEDIQHYFDFTINGLLNTPGMFTGSDSMLMAEYELGKMLLHRGMFLAPWNDGPYSLSWQGRVRKRWPKDEKSPGSVGWFMGHIYKDHDSWRAVVEPMVEEILREQRGEK